MTERTNGVKVTRRKLSEYTLDPANPNKGSVRGGAMLEHSIDVFGPARSGVVDRDGIMRAGNHTAEQLFAAGIEDVIEIEADGKSWVVVKRTDMDKQMGKAYAVADNRTGEFIEWSSDVLDTLQNEVDLSAFFSDDELAALLATDGDEPPGDPGAALSRAEEWREKWSVEKGQLWVIGRHRLLCGSAYVQDDLDRLMDGKKPDMLHIDPPYGISIVKPLKDGSTAAIGGAKPFGRTGAPGNRAIWDRPTGATGETKRHGKNAVAERNSVGSVRTPHANGARAVANVYPVMQGDVGRGNPANIIQSNVYPVIEGDDHPFDPALFLDFAPVVVMWGANYYCNQLPVSAGWICWDKREDITRNNFADGELAWTNQDKPMRIFHHLWNGLHKGSQHGERRLHPTEKPVALFEEIGKSLADKGLWIDLFAGSGAQVVAAERTGATCYAMEIEVLYVASIIERLSLMGLDPQRISGV